MVNVSMCVSLCFVLNVKMAMAVRNVFWVMLLREKIVLNVLELLLVCHATQINWICAYLVVLVFILIKIINVNLV